MLRVSPMLKTRTERIFDSSLCRRRLFDVFRGRRFTSDGMVGRKVMTFGDASSGALGLPESLMGLGSDAYEPTSVCNLPADVSSVAAGHYHSLAVSSDGEIWAWGRNNEAQLGRGMLDPRNTWSEPKRVQGLDHVKVQSAFASGVVSAAIGNDGSLWVWGKSKRGQLGLGSGIVEAPVPSRVEALAGENIAKVSFGWGHALALTIDGKLFGWGYAADGRIGNVGIPLESSPLDSYANQDKEVSALSPDAAEQQVARSMEKERSMPIAWSPRSVEELCNVEVADIACGFDHSLVLCRDGTLLSSGSNVYGQLGRSRNDLGLFQVDLTLEPISIASGLGHSLAVCSTKTSDATDEGEASVVSWGWNRSYQLGREGPDDAPSQVEGLMGITPVSVSAGRVHSLALTDKGDVWLWGCGKNGRLGLGSSCDEPEPVLLEGFEGCILQAVAGFDHSLILVTA